MPLTEMTGGLTYDLSYCMWSVDAVDAVLISSSIIWTSNCALFYLKRNSRKLFKNKTN